MTHYGKDADMPTKSIPMQDKKEAPILEQMLSGIEYTILEMEEHAGNISNSVNRICYRHTERDDENKPEPNPTPTDFTGYLAVLHRRIVAVNHMLYETRSKLNQIV